MIFHNVLKIIFTIGRTGRNGAEGESYLLDLGQDRSKWTLRLSRMMNRGKAREVRENSQAVK